MKKDDLDELRDRTLEILVDKIEQANKAYWMDNNPIISDSEYDNLIEELRKMSPMHPLLNKIGDTVDEVTFGDKLPHKKRMLSLAKAYSYEDILKWVRKVKRDEDTVFCVEPKYDGLSCEIYKGRMVTRGNGIVGSECTHIAPFVGNLCPGGAPMRVLMDPDNSIPAYGELLIQTAMFKKLREQFPELAQYKTPRNMVAGLVNTKPDVLHKLLDGKKLGGIITFCPHDGDPSFVPFADMFEDKANFDRWVNTIKNECPCPIDGIVFKIGDLNYREKFPDTAHHPTWAIAYKFKDDEYETIVRDVEWSVGNEAVTPVVIFDKVNIDGVEVTRATAHNAKFLKDNHIVPGTQIKIVRRGDVIPKIVDVAVDRSVEAKIPTKCPSCNEDLKWDGPDLVCTNDECPGRITNKIVKGLKTLGILGIGPAWVEKITRELHIPDIMCWMMESWDEALLRAKGYPEHIIRTIISEIERVVTQGVDEESIFAALCIPSASKTFAKQVISTLGGIGYVMESDLPDKMKNVPRLNTTALNNTVEFMKTKGGDFQLFLEMFHHPGADRIDEDAPKFCFTGALPISRKDLGSWLLTKGARLTENIREADFLVASNPMSQSTKMQYANKHGIKVISHEDIPKCIAEFKKA